MKWITWLHSNHILMTIKRCATVSMAIILTMLIPITASASPLAQVRLPDAKGQLHTLNSLHGHVVIVNFWASWCTPCREEMPMLNALNQRLTPFKGKVIGIALDDAVSVGNFATMFAIDYPLLVAKHEGSALMRAWGSRSGALPYTVVFNPQGNIVARLTGKVTEPQLVDLFQAHRPR